MTILLRTLARKSVLDFGKYKDRSVQQVIDLKNFRALRYYYYNCSMISFLPDILEEIGITEEWRISKPGKNPDMCKKLDDAKDHRYSMFCKEAFDNKDYKKMGMISKNKSYRRKRKMAEYIQFEKEDNKAFSKENLAWINQGH